MGIIGSHVDLTFWVQDIKGILKRKVLSHWCDGPFSTAIIDIPPKADAQTSGWGV
jgi:hypothetical protein